MKNNNTPQKRKRGSAGRTFLKVLFVIILLIVDVGIGAYIYVDYVNGLITLPENQVVDVTDSSAIVKVVKDINAYGGSTVSSDTTDATEPVVLTASDLKQNDKTDNIINIMVVGQDYRVEDEDGDGKLADTIMLFTINKLSHQLTVTSFLRDSYVQLPRHFRGLQCGMNRINASYALGYAMFGDLGAMEMMNVTILENYGVHVDGNIEVSFSSFERVIDVIGGIDVNLVGDELAYMNHVVDEYNKNLHWTLPYFDEGVNHLNGQSALWYARMRHANAADNDVNRAARQRLIIDTVVEKMKNMSLLQLNDLLNEVLPLVITNISQEDRMMYIAELLPMIFDLEVVSNQCPAEGTYGFIMKDIVGVPSSVLNIDFEKNRELLTAICEEAA